mgnify:CR=1 FL=1
MFHEKSIFFSFFLILCFFVMLLFPSEVFEGAKSGLLLWFLTVLPTLFPFLLISRLLLDSCACSLLNKLLAPVISRLFRHFRPRFLRFYCRIPVWLSDGGKDYRRSLSCKADFKSRSFLSTVIFAIIQALHFSSIILFSDIFRTPDSFSHLC